MQVDLISEARLRLPGSLTQPLFKCCSARTNCDDQKKLKRKCVKPLALQFNNVSAQSRALGK